MTEFRSLFRIVAILPVGVGLTLAACTTASQTTPPTAIVDAGEADVGIRAFTDVCLKTAPSFAKGAEQASKYGVALTMDLGTGKTGMSKDGSLSVQIKPNAECAVTTENRPGSKVRDQFLDAVAAATGEAKSVTAPFTRVVKGRTFVFVHDRKGGEAYVMIAQ